MEEQNIYQNMGAEGGYLIAPIIKIIEKTTKTASYLLSLPRRKASKLEIESQDIPIEMTSEEIAQEKVTDYIMGGEWQ